MKINFHISLLFLFIIYLPVPPLYGQSEGEYFNKAARQYVNTDIPGTEQILAEGLSKYPNDPKLNALNDKLKKEQEDQKKEQENQEQEDQNNPQEQEEKDSQEKKDGEGEEQTNEDEAGETEKNEEKSGEQSNQEEPIEEPSDLESDLSEREEMMEEMRQKLQNMNITPEQAAQILDAMNNAELRYIQQNRKKPTKRPDNSLPDW